MTIKLKLREFNVFLRNKYKSEFFPFKKFFLSLMTFFAFFLSLFFVTFFSFKAVSEFKSRVSIINYKKVILFSEGAEIENPQAVWIYLQKHPRKLTNLKKYMITTVNGVRINDLVNADINNDYNSLTDVQQAALQELAKLANYKRDISSAIKIAKNKEVWTYLQENMRLANLKTYKITIVNGVNINVLVEADTSTIYDALTGVQLTALKKLAKLTAYQTDIDQAISVVQAQVVWEDLQKNPQKLTNLKKYRITTVNGVNINDLVKADTKSDYNTLTSAQQTALKALGTLGTYRDDINQAISTTRAQVVWKYLQQNNKKLEQIKEYQINTLTIVYRLFSRAYIDPKTKKRMIPVLILNINIKALHEATKNIAYDNLTDAQKTALKALGKLKTYRTDIDDAIEQEQLRAVWTYLQKHRWKFTDLKTYKISTVNGVMINDLVEADINNDYNSLTDAQQAALQELAKLASYQADIEKAISIAQAQAVWKHLQNDLEEKFTALKTYNVTTVYGVDISELVKADTNSPYNNLTDAQKTALKALGKLGDYEWYINDSIINGLVITFLTYFKNNNVLFNLKKHNIQTVSGVNISVLLRVDINNEGVILDRKQISALWRLSELTSYQADIKKAISIAQAQAVWTYLQKHRWKFTDLKTHKISAVNGVRINDLVNADINNDYNSLTDAQQAALQELAKLATYQADIEKAISTAQSIVKETKKTKAAWTNLQNNNKLVNLIKYNIQTVNGVDINALLKFKKGVKYNALKVDEQKTLKQLMKKISDEEITTEIKKTKEVRRQILVKAFQTPGGVLDQLKTKAKKELKIGQKLFSFEALLKINWKAPAFKSESLTTKAEKELLELYAVVNSKDKVKKIAAAIAKIETKSEKEDFFIGDQAIIGISFGLGFLFLVVLFGVIFCIRKKNQKQRQLQ